MAEQTPTGDTIVADNFLQGRAGALGGTSDGWMRALGSGGPQTQPAPPAASGAPGEAAPAPPQDTGPAPAPAPDRDSSLTLSQLITGVPPKPANANLPLGAKILNGLSDAANFTGRVVKDVGLGVIDAPRQVAGGVDDYVNNLFRFADKVVSKMDAAGVPNVYFQLFDPKGNWDPQVMSAAQFRAAQAAGKADVFQIPTTGGPDTVTGGIIRQGTTFLLARKPFINLMGGGLVSELASDFLGGVTGTNPGQERLSNVIQRVAPNFVTDWLQAKPGDEKTLLGNLKSGLEMAGMGAAFAGTVASLRALKGALSGSPDEIHPVPPPGAGPGEGAPPPAAPATTPGAADHIDPEAMAAELKAARSTGEYDYGMSTEAIGEPNPYRVWDREMKAVPAEVQDRFQVHGTSDEAGLINMLTNGIDKNRGFNSGPPTPGMHGVDTTRTTSPYLILSDPDKMIPETGIKTVIVQGPAERNIPALQQAFPGVRFLPVDQAPRFMTEAASGDPMAELAQFDTLGTGMPPKAGVAPAIRDENGAVHYGQPGQLHADVAEQMRPGVGVLAADADKWDLGFAGPNGTFLTREQAATALGQSKPLESTDQIPTEGPAGTAPRLGPPGERAPLSFEPTPQATQAAEDFLAGKRGDNPVKINLDYVQAPDDIKQMVEQLSTLIPSGDVQSHEATDLLAKSLGLTPDDMLHGIQGQAPNAAQMRAMALINISSAQKVGDFVKDYLANPTPESKALAIRALTTQYAIQSYFQGAKTETARALNILQMVRGPQADYAEAVGKMIHGVANSTDGGDLDDLFGKINDLGNPAVGGDPVKVSAFIGKTMQPGMSGRSALLKFWYNVLLSNPRTVIKKFASDTGMAMWNIATRAYAEMYGGSGEVQPGETGALAYGYISSVKDGLRLAGRGLRAGESQFFPEFQSMDAYDAVRGGQFTPDGMPDVAAARASRLTALAGLDPAPYRFDQPSLGAFSYLRSALPTSWIGAADDFWKYMNYNAERYALVYRQGMDKGLDGDELSTFVQDQLNNTPPAIHEQALASALKTTFQEPLGRVAGALQNFVDGLNLPVAHTGFEIPLGRIIMPFIKVPLNIAKWSYENSPLAAAFPSSPIRAALQAGGAQRDLAIARMTLGSMVALGFADLALNNVITGRGPTDPQLQRAWRAAGNEPYSIHLGDKWYGFNQIEPMGLMASAIADTFSIMRFAKDDGRENLASSLAFGIGNAILSKTYMQGVANFFDALMHPDSEGNYYADRMVQSFTVPTGVRAVATGLDEWRRAHYGMIDGLEASLPMVSKGLPPARTLWGDPIKATDAFMPFLSGTGVARAISPIPMAPANNAEPIDKWIWDNRMAFPQGPSNRLGLTKPGLVQNFYAGNHVSTQVQLTPEQLDRFTVLAGNGLKDPQTGLGAKDALNALVQNRYPDANLQHQWDGASPAAKALIVQSVVNRFRDAAKKALIEPGGPYQDQNLTDVVQQGWTSRAGTLGDTAQ